MKQMILHLSITELKVKYRGTFLGFIWSVLEPIVQLAVLYVVFTAIRLRGDDFIEYLFIGLIFIHFFSRSTTQGMNSIIKNKSIVNSINIPKFVFPSSIVLSNFYMFMIETGVFLIMILILQTQISSTIVYFPIIIGLLIVFTMGISLILSTVRMYFKDIQSVWSIVTMSLIFITPVFWRVENMTKDLADILLLNPLALLMELAHQTILFGEFPSNSDMIYVTITTGLIFGVGWYIFHRKEKKMAELL
jgi:ABC-type polysaccharide/polyol phosphate export permease